MTIDLRRSAHRSSIFEGQHIYHRSSKVDTSIVDLRKSSHRSSKVDTSIIDLRRSTHRSSKIEGRNIAPTTQHRTDIPTIRHRKLSTTALHSYLYPRFRVVRITLNFNRRRYTRPYTYIRQQPHTCTSYVL